MHPNTGSGKGKSSYSNRWRTSARLSASGNYYVVKLYRCWAEMRNRCKNPNNTGYKHYGARDITVCAEWNEYPVFRRWALAHGFSKGMTIERRDVNGNYEPNNCKFIPANEQWLNRRSVRDERGMFKAMDGA